MAAADVAFLQDLAVVLVVAAVTAVAFSRARQPVVLGYIVAGIIVGPFTPPFAFVQDQATIETLGQIGVVFLLFGLGLHFDLRRLRAVGMTAAVAGTLQILLMIWIGYVVGRAFGLTSTDSLFLGAIVSISSTVIIVKIVSEFRQQEEKWAQVAFGILIIEDILAVCILTVLSGTGGTAPPSLGALAVTLGNIGLFIATAVVAGLLVVPRVISYLARFPAEEILLVAALGFASGLALFGTLLGFSPALGAFIMGALIAASRDAVEVDRLVRPVRDMFGAIFFVSVGMLFDPGVLVTHWLLIAAVTAAVIAGKVASVTFAVFITGHEPRTALRTGFSLAQVGEFSFIIAALGVTLGVTVAPLYEVAVAVAAITAFTTPLLIKNSNRVSQYAAARAPRALVTFAMLYDTWIARLRRPPDATPTWRGARRHAVRATVLAAVLLEVVVLGSGLAPLAVGALLGAFPQVGLAGAQMVAWAAAALVALPFGYLFLMALRGLASALSDASLPAEASTGAHGQAIRGVLRNAFIVAGTVGIGVAVLSLASPFVPALPLVSIVAFVVLAAGAFLWRSLEDLQRRLDAVLASALGGPDGGHSALEDADIVHAIQEKYPWGIEERVVALDARSWAAGQTVAHSRVRTLTGATILDIERGAHKILNPSPEETMEAGDRVVLVGEQPQLVSAAALLEAGPPDDVPPETPPTVGEVTVGAGSVLVGATLASLHLRERTGVTVLGIVRKGKGVKDPSPEIALEAGDVLVVFGTLAQLQEAGRMAGQDEARLPHDE